MSINSLDNSIPERLQGAIASYRDSVDYLEIRVEQSELTSIAFRGSQLDAVDRSFTLTAGIRACPELDSMKVAPVLYGISN